MKILCMAGAALALALSCPGIAGSGAAEITGRTAEEPGRNVPEERDQEVLSEKLEQAYIYTLPLMIMDATNTKMTNTVEATSQQAPPNQLFHAKALATAASRNVVTPNVDTIYSQVMLDLSDDAVILELPKTDRFCMAEVLDAYTNCISLIDAAAFEDSKEAYIFTGRNFTGDIPAGMQRVECPTDLAWVIIRTISYGEDDIPNVHAIQQKMDSYTLSQVYSGETDQKPRGAFHDEYNFIPAEHVMGMSMEDYFTRANVLMTENPPAPEDAAFLNGLARIGVGPGLSFDGALFGETAAEDWRRIVQGVTASCAEASGHFQVKNGSWNYFGGPIAQFGTEYEYRALIALMGLGANPVSVAVYPKAAVDSEGQRLNGANSYLLHFDKDALPPVKERGFWSVTIYDSSDNLLIDNEIGRYCINDRSDVRYQEDGSLDILIQKEKPDAEWQSNWLPACEGEFHLYLRVYLPEDEVVRNEWSMPMILKR